MSADLRIVSLLILLLILSSCSLNSDTVKANLNSPQDGGQQNLPERPGPNSKSNPNTNTCFPEKSLVQTTQTESLNAIVGGDRVYQSEPDANRVVLLFNTEGAICTAAPIARDVLLTAAHCALSTIEKYVVVYYSSLTCESGFDITNLQMVGLVKELVVHEAYSDSAPASQLKGDLALVFLSKDIPVNYPIYRIADPNLVNSSNFLKLYGYGSVGYGKRGSGIMRKTELPAVSYKIDRTDQKVYVDQSAGNGVCSGDSGGPGLVDINGEFQILGVNSYVSSTNPNEDACKDSAALVLVDSYRDWIEIKMAARNRYLKQ